MWCAAALPAIPRRCSGCWRWPRPWSPTRRGPMADARKQLAPAAYAPIEAALRSLETGATDRWVAGQLEAVDHPSAQRAVALLRAGRWRAATNELEFALEELAGA